MILNSLNGFRKYLAKGEESENSIGGGGVYFLVNKSTALLTTRLSKAYNRYVRIPTMPEMAIIRRNGVLFNT
jgi:hypothetical protein